MFRALLLTLIAVAGCAGSAPAMTAVGDSPPEPDPAALLGWWRVDGAGAVVALGPGDLAVRLADPAGRGGDLTLTGTWRADPAGRFLARVDATDGPVPDPAAPADPPADGVHALTPPWLAAAAGFRTDGADRVLLDRAGAPVARLVSTSPLPADEVGGVVDPDREPAPGEWPDAVPAGPVPAPLEPRTAPELTGYWFPVGATNSAFLHVDEDGTWTGSDGCNGVAGAWVVGPGGGFLATAPAVRTLVLCEGGADVATQLGQARRVAAAGAELVLLDVDGAELGRYYRASRGGVGEVGTS